MQLQLHAQQMPRRSAERACLPHRTSLFRATHAARQLTRQTTVRLVCRSAEQQAEEEDISGDYCMPAYVTFDNKANPNFTVLEVEVQDYPGLLRVLSWTLNGLDLIAQNAIVRTNSDGTAQNTFWVSTIAGKKLSDARAELVAERVRDFVMYCSPKGGMQNAKEFSVGPVTVTNTEHDNYTVVYVREARPTPGFLLEVASVLSGLNAQIYQGVIQGCTNCGEDVPKLVDDIKGQDGRLFKFWVQDRQGAKLDYNHISALIYGLGVGLGFQTFPLAPPDQEVLLGAKH